MIEKKRSLLKSQELDFSKTKFIDLIGKHKHKSTVSSGLYYYYTGMSYNIQYVMNIMFSLDEETIEDYQKPQETELVKIKHSKLVDEDKSVISDKTLMALEG